MSQPTYDCFAITAPGLEPITAAELTALGMTTTVERGGVSWTASLDGIYRANLHLRTASRVLVRVGRFHARTFAELERHAKRIRWDDYVTRHRAVRFRVTCKKSRLYHSDAVMQRLANVVAPIVGDPALVGSTRHITGEGDEEHAGATPAHEGTTDVSRGLDEPDAVDAQLFVVRIERDEVTISADTSGALLHRRGYRQAVAKAPLRETLAAAMVLASGWDRRLPLIDPLCGSGTIVIEAALIARRIAPGLHRTFACLRWPRAEFAQWNAEVARARDEILDRAPGMFRASDRDEGAVRAALANAERAGVAADIDVSHRAISAVEPAGGRGWILANPPYGLRVGDRTVRDLYAQLGNVARRIFPTWHVGLLCAYDNLLTQTRIRFEQSFSTSNGGIPVRFMTGVVTGSSDRGVPTHPRKG
jgi:putative N6-adenine-specific DNA methylase